MKARKPTSGRRGFSLIEMLVVVAIIALIMVVALPAVNSFFKVSLSSSGHEIASIVKETYNSAIITGKVHRIVWDMKKNQYWVESGPPSVLLDTKESREKEERRRRFLSERAQEKEKQQAPAFTLEKSVTRGKTSLPNGASFEDVQTEQSSEPITEGTAYTHVFPHGFIEQSIVHLRDQSNHRMTLVVNPIGGQTDVYERYATAQEIFAEQPSR